MSIYEEKDDTGPAHRNTIVGYNGSGGESIPFFVARTAWYSNPIICFHRQLTDLNQNSMGKKILLKRPNFCLSYRFNSCLISWVCIPAVSSTSLPFFSTSSPTLPDLCFKTIPFRSPYISSRLSSRITTF